MTVLVVFLFLVLIVSVAVFVMFRLDANRREQQARTTRLNQTWRVMHAANRINVAHWRAREAMRRESERGTWRGGRSW